MKDIAKSEGANYDIKKIAKIEINKIKKLVLKKNE